MWWLSDGVCVQGPDFLFLQYVAKMRLGTRQRPMLPVSMCNFTASRRSNLLLFISHNKENVNTKYRKSLWGRPADLTRTSNARLHYRMSGGRKETGTIWLVCPIPDYKLELDEWMRRAGCSGELLPSLPSLFADGCADRTGQGGSH